MFKKFVQKFVLLSLLALGLAPFALASGKMEVALGQPVLIQAEDSGINTSYQWLVKRGTEILFTQNKPILEYTFLEAGEYEAVATSTDRFDRSSQTSVFILVGDTYDLDRASAGSRPAAAGPLAVSYQTLPSRTSQNTIPLIGAGTVAFDIDALRPDVVEYRIDRNVFADSDGNGIANDDIDNSADDSYLRGGVWETAYAPGEAAKIVPEITLVTRSGETAKAQAEVIFETQASSSAPLTAILDLLPRPNPEQQVELYKTSQTVGFYARRSQGPIKEYRIDRNIFADSDGDGDPQNDIDNFNTPSFSTGDVWTTSYEKTGGQIIAQLIVVSPDGKGSRVQREVVFTDRPPSDLGPAASASPIFISADKDFVLKGNPVLLSIEGLSQSARKYTFEWDLDGDGEAEKSIEGENTVTHAYDAPGVHPIKVKVTGEDGQSAELSLDLLVKEAEKTTADFEFSAEGNTVTFISRSQAAFNLADKALSYSWNFGDTDEEGYLSQKEQSTAPNPVYRYRYKGRYLVTLTVADADRVVDSKTMEVSIEQGEEGEGAVSGQETPTGETPASSSGPSLTIKILKWLGWIVLGLLALLTLALVGLFATFKVQHPDLLFDELVDEFKMKLLSLLGLRDLIEPSGPAAPQPPPSSPSAGPASSRPPASPNPPAAPPQKPASVPLPAVQPGSAGPLPDWLKPKPASPASSAAPADRPAPPKPQIIEGEAEELKKSPASSAAPADKPAPANAPKVNPPSAQAPAAPFPDWLKPKPASTPPAPASAPATPLPPKPASPASPAKPADSPKPSAGPASAQPPAQAPRPAAQPPSAASAASAPAEPKPTSQPVPGPSAPKPPAQASAKPAEAAAPSTAPLPKPSSPAPTPQGAVSPPLPSVNQIAPKATEASPAAPSGIPPAKPDSAASPSALPLKAAEPASVPQSKPAPSAPFPVASPAPKQEQRPAEPPAAPKPPLPASPLPAQKEAPTGPAASPAGPLPSPAPVASDADKAPREAGSPSPKIIPPSVSATVQPWPASPAPSPVSAPAVPTPPPAQAKPADSAPRPSASPAPAPVQKESAASPHVQPKPDSSDRPPVPAPVAKPIESPKVSPPAIQAKPLAPAAGTPAEAANPPKSPASVPAAPVSVVQPKPDSSGQPLAPTPVGKPAEKPGAPAAPTQSRPPVPAAEKAGSPVEKIVPPTSVPTKLADSAPRPGTPPSAGPPSAQKATPPAMEAKAATVPSAKLAPQPPSANSPKPEVLPAPSVSAPKSALAAPEENARLSSRPPLPALAQTSSASGPEKSVTQALPVAEAAKALPSPAPKAPAPQPLVAPKAPQAPAAPPPARPKEDAKPAVPPAAPSNTPSPSRNDWPKVLELSLDELAQGGEWHPGNGNASAQPEAKKPTEPAAADEEAKKNLPDWLK